VGCPPLNKQISLGLKTNKKKRSNFIMGFGASFRVGWLGVKNFEEGKFKEERGEGFP